MNTIRPLATIAILAGLGYFLATQINKNPASDAEELTENWGEAPQYKGGGEAPSEAPPFTPPPPPEVSPPTAGALGGGPASVEAVSPATEAGMPDLSPPTQGAGGAANTGHAGMPALPSSGARGAAPQEIPLPENIASADYSGPSGDREAPSASPSPAPTTSPAPASDAASYEDPYAQYDPATPNPGPADASGVPPIGAGRLNDAQSAPRGAASYEESSAPSYGQPEAPSPSQPNVPTHGQAEAPSYATPGASPYGSPGAAPAGGSSYQAALPMIQSALDNQELRRAHGLLSEWYASESLSPVEREQVDRLLSQLAGTVVYSTEHLMEPPYVVRAGDTMETIAEKHNVPWRLLAKINGVPRADAVRPGQVIKVLRGPFSAIVDLSESELALIVDGKYAGKFSAQASGAAQTEGKWRVDQKKITEATPTRYGAPEAAGSQIVLKSSTGSTIVLGPESTHGTGAAQGRVSVAQAAMEELSDILSVGSEVTIRR